MNKILMTQSATLDAGYEYYQTIIDFDHPIQIFREAFQNSVDEDATEVYCNVFLEKILGIEDLYIDIWDNGKGLKKEDVDCFFGLAKSTKVREDKTPIPGKLGYKGHGTKIFFRSEQVEICSKTIDGELWGVVLDKAVKQIRDSGNMPTYSHFLNENELSVKFPNQFNTGFYLRIKNPHLFKTQRYMLNHMYLRDYSKWYTVFGNIRNAFEKPIVERFLYLRDFQIDHFMKDYSTFASIDPVPEFTKVDSREFEKIQIGHYFPLQRSTDTAMKKYSKKVGKNKPYHEYYSKEIFKERIFLDNNLFFDFIMFSEGYETKRRYDILLSKGSTPIPESLHHMDAERYGFWACKGGVPIEKIDDWVKGGRGVGTYTYLHAFIDCDFFELTGTRGSIRNTDLEIIDNIKQKMNEIIALKRIRDIFRERSYWEEAYKTERKVDEDLEELNRRFNAVHNRKFITLPNKQQFQEPSRTERGFSESETLILLIHLLTIYPNLFTFKLLDYNTNKGIDFVVKRKGQHPAYIELKGFMESKINHSFRNIHKFICYDIDLKDGDILEDPEGLKAQLRINEHDRFESFDSRFNKKKFTSYQLNPQTTAFDSMEIIVLKKILTEVIGAKFE